MIYNFNEYKLFEYLTPRGLDLYHYFNQSIEDKKNYLPHVYYFFWGKFFKEKGIQYDSSDLEDFEITDDIQENNPQLYKEFCEWLYDRIINHTLNIHSADYPAWAYYDSPQIVKNTWLVHFTDNADSIVKNGFTKGVSEIEKLALTTHLGEFDKKYGGYNFAYTIYDFKKYGKGRHGYKYGKELVIFKASGVKLSHSGDEEDQTIFWGKEATCVNAIENKYGDWVIRSKVGNKLYENEKLEKVVDWVVNNYDQYRKVLN